jgi:hypothetical protein
MMLSPKRSKVSLIGSGALFFSLSLLPFLASAQSQGDNASVADAARRAREQKKAITKPARTLTNDDLPTAPAQRTQPTVAPTGAAETLDADQAEAGGETTPPAKAPATVRPVAEPDAKRSEREAALKRAKADLAQAQGELDVLERKAALDRDTFYSKTGYASDSEGKARLDAEAQQISDKKSQVDDLKAKVVALQAELGQTAEADKPVQPL